MVSILGSHGKAVIIVFRAQSAGVRQEDMPTSKAPSPPGTPAQKRRRDADEIRSVRLSKAEIPQTVYGPHG